MAAQERTETETRTERQRQRDNLRNICRKEMYKVNRSFFGEGANYKLETLKETLTETLTEERRVTFVIWSEARRPLRGYGS